ncbi:MAG TPA: hypothetical protein DCM71_15920 [Runella sp.]|nr:hypothetical protein [Runella sp.]
MGQTLLKTCFFLLLFATSRVGVSQIRSHAAPGGVKGATQWLIADTLAGESRLISQLRGKPSLSPQNPRSIGWLNHYPALLLNETNSLSANLGREELHKATFFTVYQAKPTDKEHLIWFLEKEKKISLVLTTERVADLENYRYMNFTDVAPTKPKIAIYSQSKPKDTVAVANQTWNIGQLPTSVQLPVSVFNGLLPEIIVFNRTLDREERLKVASYLALKYGITLSETSATYLNSRGEIIWNGEQSPTYHHNIAGIGRDDASAWLQKIASSSNAPHFLSISTPAALPNNHFLLWGDNDQPLSPAPNRPGIPALLRRHWQLAAFGKQPIWDTKIVLDTKSLYTPIPQNPVFWMVIDSSGTGEFSPLTTHYHKMRTLDAQGFAHFEVVLKTNTAQKNTFSFMVAGELLLATAVGAPTCAKPESGRFQVKVVGGLPPYHLRVLNKTTGQSTSRYLQDNRLTELLTGLTAGKYELKVTDARQQVYLDSLWLQPTDAPLPVALATAYELPTSKPLPLNAAKNMPADVAYHWQGPNGFESSSPEVALSQSGNYTLTTTLQGCSYTHEIQVNSPLVSLFSAVEVYPNPSNGRFTIKMMLHHPADVRVSVYNTEGKFMFSKTVSGADRYIINEQLASSGLYHVVLQSENAVSTNKLLISP